MSAASGQSERRQFGRRWSHILGWIAIEGRPRTACHVKNFSEGGALLMVPDSIALPFTFLLHIDAIDFKIGCEVRHRGEGHVGVRFISADLVSEVGPIWTIDELMAKAGATVRKVG